MRKITETFQKNCSQSGRANVTTTWLWPSLDFEMRRTDLICIATSTTFTSITRSSNYFTLFKDGFFLALVTTSWPIRQIVEYFSPLFLKSRLVKVLALIVPSCNSNPTYFAHSWFFYTATTLFCYSTEQPREKLNFARIGALGLTSIVAKVASKNKKAKKVGGGLMTPPTPPTCPVAVALCYAARSVRGWKLTQPKRHLKAIQIHSGMKAAKNQEAV